jgi:hypothetical protein
LHENHTREELLEELEDEFGDDDVVHVEELVETRAWK